MTNKSQRIEDSAEVVREWARFIADVTEDSFRAVIGFVPDGLQLSYDLMLKKLPKVGPWFSIKWLEATLKIISGITIGQGLATDIARFIFWPMGYSVGSLVGLGAVLLNKPNPPKYHEQIGRGLYKVSSQTVNGAIVGLMALVLGTVLFPGLKFLDHSALAYTIAIVGGGLVGLTARLMLFLSVNMVVSANAATVRRNVKRSKDLSVKLKNVAKQRAKKRIVLHAQETIQQMNGPQVQKHLNDFINKNYGNISKYAYEKIDRHLNYLSDRACHGDIKALKKLYQLIPSQPNLHPDEKTALDNLLDRIFNKRSVEALKDQVDTSYDKWRYQHLRKASD